MNHAKPAQVKVRMESLNCKPNHLIDLLIKILSKMRQMKTPRNYMRLYEVKSSW
jgi:hypothetical protein